MAIPPRLEPANSQPPELAVKPKKPLRARRKRYKRSCHTSPTEIIFVFWMTAQVGRLVMNLYLLQVGTYIGNSHCFDVYWNIPSQTCQQFGIYINASSLELFQNTDDVFYGDKVSIFYGPGKFPWIENDSPVNGGIPQNASLVDHLQVFADEVTKKLPPNFRGVAVLDFEKYYPCYEINPAEYKKASRDWVKAQHPSWTPSQIEAEAIRAFNESSREFFEILLWKGREIHPEALWGYYHYPYCHNYGPRQQLVSRNCTTQPVFNDVITHNDEMLWLMEASTALYPSIYIFKDSGWDPMSRRRNALVRLKEAIRVRRNTGKNIPILPYFWYRYHDSPDYLTPMDITNTLGLSKVMNLDGIVLWGSTHDLRTEEMCMQFKNFVEEKLGPVARYVFPLRRPFSHVSLTLGGCSKKFAYEC
ncbi:hyaluronidase B-like [Macrobrachium nipponense]|uniref:hyaluronidase B-like n=1 Tax=Macrobrachium nipponense TaxID=159736 RepID=UPI0030C7E645